ncbi:MAG: phosphate ABC transporter substrate-binding protein [Candidatus Eremiobacteraeota bacterium]|nr:phosphate ABC transporter substrate-binding protein [Candidatus Eremiobacteraeota bacterium]
MRNPIVFSLVLFVATACTNNSGQAPQNSGRSGNITVAGSTALLPLVKQAAQDYQAAHAAIRISVAGGGSRVGLTQAEQKGVDIGDSDIPPGATQQDLIDHKVAVVIFAVIVNPSTGVTALSKSQIADIFSGKVTNWKQVGGADHPITLVNRPKSSGTRAVFVATLMGGHQPSASALTQDSSGTVVTTVAQTPGATSYVSTGYLKNARVTPLKIDGVSPDAATVKSGRYAFWAYEHMVTAGTPPKPVADFIAFVAKDRALLHRVGFLATDEVRASGQTP